MCSRLLAFFIIAVWSGQALAMYLSVEPAQRVLSGQRVPVHFAYAHGLIEPGSADAIAQITDLAHAQAKVILTLESDGGSLFEAMRIGRFLRSNRIATHVAANSSGCHSACFLAFIGGYPRTVETGGLLGVHQFRSTYAGDGFAAESSTQWVSSEILDYLEEMGLDLYVLYPILRTPSEQIHILDHDVLEPLRVTTPACPWPFGYVVNDPMRLYPQCLAAR